MNKHKKRMEKQMKEKAPLAYPLKTSDNNFRYETLPKQSKPVPPRAKVPDMNKHKKRMEKQMKESGITSPLMQYKAQNAAFSIDEDDIEEKTNEFNDEEILNINDKAKSAPVPNIEENNKENIEQKGKENVI